MAKTEREGESGGGGGPALVAVADRVAKSLDLVDVSSRGRAHQRRQPRGPPLLQGEECRSFNTKYTVPEECKKPKQVGRSKYLRVLIPLLEECDCLSTTR